MSIFCPDISRIGDTDVPVVCPNCGAESKRDRLLPAEKHYLIDATGHHRLLAEYRQLVAMKAIVDRFPGTQHPLLRGKLENSGRGFTDERVVAALLNAQPELCEMLRHSMFLLSRRFRFVRDMVSERHEALLPLLVCCEMCPQQYLILPDQYYESIG
ncbi:MAG TPA: hypothetical protein VG125_26755 [Pirellulales bacterium]|nr:hypothetical protein [Pirellulales bacterium]